MSTSRLEKFVYVICSMEVSDLPVPLSRIEKLWNCLITGETPDFEPLSRNEKYLMAMLGLYELDQLPTPLSRGEKLLYKIAVGETDLSDVPGYLSRYEELLKYLIENGGIGNFEYVLQTLNQSLSTLYQTVEKPVKSAILTGQTLVNIKEGVKETETRPFIKEFFIPQVQKNTDYLIKYNTESSISDAKDVAIGFLSSSNQWSNHNENGPLNGTIILNSGNNPYCFRFNGKNTSSSLTINSLMIIEYQDGMENWDIPYFEGMQSVKMPVLTTTGKNLFNVNHFSKLENWDRKTTTKKPYDSYEIKLEPNTTYTFSRKEESIGSNIYFCISKKKGEYDLGGGIVHPTVPSGTAKLRTITTDSTGILYLNLYQASKELANLIPLLEDAQIEVGTQATTYEPYKSNILSTSEDVVLRKVGDVQDTLDCLTGEVTERVGEIVLDGSEDWTTYNYLGTQIFKTIVIGIRDDMNELMCNRINKSNAINNDTFHFKATSNGIEIMLDDSSITTIDNFKQYISLSKENPIIIQYKLATKSIKTVDLTTVDQDGQPTKLKTFNDITYVEMNADNIIPSVNIEVATKINETLSTMGLEHHDISETQNKLSQTIDEQTENTDATMMATTEIYENL